MQYSQNHGRKTLSPAGGVLALASAGAAFYLMLNYLGPYQWLAEFQLRRLGSYSEKLTLILTTLLIWAALMIVTWPLRRLFFVASTGQRRGTEFSTSLITMIIGLGFAFFGVRKLHTAQNAGGLTQITAQSLESGQAPQSLWVRVQGLPLDRLSISFGQGSSKDLYVPVIAPTNQTLPASGVRLFLKVDRRSTYRRGSEEPAEYQGMLEPADLPGPVRVTMGKRGLLKGSDYYVLEVGQYPARKAQEGKVMMWIGLAMTAVGIVIGIAARIRRYTSPAASPQNAI